MKLKKNIKFSSKVENLSKSSEKKGDLLIQVNELMEKMENDYGPLMLEELQKRLKKTIEDFHDDVNIVLKDAFSSDKSKILNKKNKSIDSEDGVPSFIAEYQNKKNKK